ncbi:MAG: protein kinase, partial [Verrucomicrobia bacterium]|nr:protein kinase [Verrucomicrobiota bacterium]
MRSSVTLDIVKGALSGKAIVFDQRDSIIIGRGDGCVPQLPSDAAHSTVSRNHCLIDINPPDVRVRDFGSLNGTFVNGKKIGQRAREQTAEEGAQSAFPEHDLNNGDTLTIGDTTICVHIFVPKLCVECGVEISEEDAPRLRQNQGVYKCDACSATAQLQTVPAAFGQRRCIQCGKDASSEIGPNRQGDYICVSCQGDPLSILNHLLDQRETVQGDVDLIRIQGYAIEQELGRGGVGAVYLARNLETGRRVALKVMLPQVASDEESRNMFLREIDNTKVLKHENVVQLFDAGYSEGMFYFTLEFCDGGGADAHLKRSPEGLAVDDAVGIILQVLHGLEYAHSVELSNVSVRHGRGRTAYGLVHRDLKPANIFLCGQGKNRIAKIGDYGLGKAFDTAGLSGHTRTNQVGGTPNFMPRQQVLNFKYAQPDVDVWGAAASLYSLLTGAVPRDFQKDRDVWQVVLSTNPVPIR